MNVLDVIIIAAIGGMIGVGFFVGVSRVTAGIISIYFASIVTATFYGSLASFFESLSENINPDTADLVAFVIMFVVMTSLFTWLITHSIRASNMVGRFAILNNVGGAGLGIVVAGVAIALSMTIITLLLQVLATTSSGAAGGMLGTVQSQVSGSALAPIFMRLLPILTSSIRPWFPGGLPDILTSAHTV